MKTHENPPGTMKNHENLHFAFLQHILSTLRLNRTPLIQKTLRDKHGAFKKVIIFHYKHTLFVTNRGIQLTFKCLDCETRRWYWWSCQVGLVLLFTVHFLELMSMSTRPPKESWVTEFFPSVKEKFIPKFWETPNMSPNSKTTLSPDLGIRESTILKWSKHSVKASNKMLEGETVSGRSRHRSNHARNRVPSVVAGHQFQEFGCIGPESRIFPTTVIVTHPGFCSKTNHFSTHLPSPNLLFRICC